MTKISIGSDFIEVQGSPEFEKKSIEDFSALRSVMHEKQGPVTKSNWQVQGKISINVYDCEDGDEAIQRVKLCYPRAIIPSVKGMRIIAISKLKAIQQTL